MQANATFHQEPKRRRSGSGHGVWQSSTSLTRVERGWVPHLVARIYCTFEESYHDFCEVHGKILGYAEWRERQESHSWWVEKWQALWLCVCQRLALTELLKIGHDFWNSWPECVV